MLAILEQLGITISVPKNIEGQPNKKDFFETEPKRSNLNTEKLFVRCSSALLSFLIKDPAALFKLIKYLLPPKPKYLCRLIAGW
jgi:hypothetical protein